MKIEIEFNSSYEATVNIDGRELKLEGRRGMWTFEGMTCDEGEGTIGGIVANKLMMPLIDILQGWMPDEESPDDDCWETWEKLTESAADEVYDAIG